MNFFFSRTFLLFSTLRFVGGIVECEYSAVARDQGSILNGTVRSRRFVLFPEFHLWLNDSRYLNSPRDFRFWTTNFYPGRINSTRLQFYIEQLIGQLSPFVERKIRSVQRATTIDEANFHYQFFNYQICPTADPLAVVAGVQSISPLLIYSPEIVKKSRYRAHGGITWDYQKNISISHTKYNIHHEFLFYEDFQYDPVIYRCNADESHCQMDLYAVMLHETLHGFGIEHTEAKLPNAEMRAVMHLYASRIPCHDDIRALRRVYGLKVIRSNAKFDDTCRRDFPMNALQYRMRQIHQWIVLCLFKLGPLISSIVFVLTSLYLLFRRRTPSLISSQDTPSVQSKSPVNAFLWHDDYFLR